MRENLQQPPDTVRTLGSGTGRLGIFCTEVETERKKVSTSEGGILKITKTKTVVFQNHAN